MCIRDSVDAAAKKGGKIGIISCGWDPGMFSLNRLYANCILPEGQDYTFWGKGVSQGHSDAVRRIEGVKAVSYTHLDVYKRQEMASEAVRRSAIASRAYVKLDISDVKQILLSCR